MLTNICRIKDNIKYYKDLRNNEPGNLKPKIT